ncbi:hypothetical protein ACFWN5_17060 [Streptomyces sp. NPDC058430]|uniref:hypothetical protein n=1 Tax=Streptomyces sp. NPDC058430 TaxID=3346495 RepID=UPI00365B0741
MAPHCAAGTDSVVVVLIGRRSGSRAPRHRARGTAGAVAPLGMVGALGMVGVVESVGVAETVGTVGVVETAGTGTVVVETAGTGTVVAGAARTPEAAQSPQCAARTNSLVVLIRRQPLSRVPRHGAVGAVGPLGAIGTGSVVASDGCGTGRRLSRTAEVTRTTPVITARRTPQHHKPPTADTTRTTPVITARRTPQHHKPPTAETTRNTQVITARCAIRQHKPPTAEVTRRALLLIGAAPSGSRGS